VNERIFVSSFKNFFEGAGGRYVEGLVLFHFRDQKQWLSFPETNSATLVGVFKHVKLYTGFSQTSL